MTDGRGLLFVLHPLTLLAYAGVVLLLTLLTDHPLLQAGLFLSVLALALAGGLRRGLVAWMRFGFFTGLMVVLVNALVNHNGSTVICRRPWLPLLGAGPVTAEALVYGGVMALRLLTIMLAFHLYSRTVAPDDLTAACRRGASRLALTVILALRFFPVMSAEATRLLEVRRTRGWTEGRGFLNRLRARLPLLQALLVAALERSWQVGEAMQARGFGAGPRSSYLALPVRPRDLIWRYALLLSLAGAAWLGWRGALAYRFYPHLQGLAIMRQAPGMILVVVGLWVPVLAAWWWQRWPYLRSKI